MAAPQLFLGSSLHCFEDSVSLFENKLPKMFDLNKWPLPQYFEDSFCVVKIFYWLYRQFAQCDGEIGLPGVPARKAKNNSASAPCDHGAYFEKPQANALKCPSRLSRLTLFHVFRSGYLLSTG